MSGVFAVRHTGNLRAVPGVFAGGALERRVLVAFFAEHGGVERERHAFELRHSSRPP